jgi:shikimate dehydrogenase
MIIAKKSIKAGVIGDPIVHSLSPKIHQYWLKKYQIDGTYDAIKITKENLTSAVESLIKEGFAGFNVTIPHKEEIFKICHHLSNSAKLTKAVNTIIILEDKLQGPKIFGHNSDIDGFLKNLWQSCPDFDLKDKTAFVIGAGGAARAVIYGLIKSKVKNIFITNRNLKRAENLIADFTNLSSNLDLNILEQKIFEENLSKCDLLINTTSLGMINSPKLTINLTNLPKSAIIYDLVYNPLITDLLKEGQQRGNKIVTGIGMLINQATIGFEAWFKCQPEIDDNLAKVCAATYLAG